MMLQFEERTVEPDITILVLTGRMHLGNRLSESEWAAKQIINAGKKKLILDVTGVDHIDSAALGMLILTTGNMSLAGGRVLIAGANERVMEVINIAHAEMILSLHADVDSAVRAFAS